MFSFFRRLSSDKIVRINLKMMTGKSKEQLPTLLSNESMGGNAGKIDGQPCICANFWYDGSTGEIKKFTNEDVPAECKEGRFRVLMPNIKDFLRTRLARKFPEIVRADLSKGTSVNAKLRIAESVQLYNQLGKKIIRY